jgi:hypothetical protein
MDSPILTVPVAEPREFNDPITISLSATPVNANVPVVASATLCAPTVAEVNAAVPKLTAVSFGPLAPTWSVPVVPTPVLLIVAEAIVPSVFVPVEEVKPVAKVDTPRMLGIVAVEIVAVEIVAVLADSVPIVAVPVEAVMFDPNVTLPSWRGIVAVLIVAVLIVAVEIVAVLIVAVLAESVPIVAVPVVAEMLELKVTAPVTPRLEDNVTAPVTARLDDSVVAPATFSVPVDLTPAVDSCNALDVLSPSVMACNVPSIPPKPSVLSSCG